MSYHRSDEAPPLVSMALHRYSATREPSGNGGDRRPPFNSPDWLIRSALLCCNADPYLVLVVPTGRIAAPRPDVFTGSGNAGDGDGSGTGLEK
ncbi:unnamed protein product [Merluccius merluccius]